MTKDRNIALATTAEQILDLAERPDLFDFAVIGPATAAVIQQGRRGAQHVELNRTDKDVALAWGQTADLEVLYLTMIQLAWLANIARSAIEQCHPETAIGSGYVQ